FTISELSRQRSPACCATVNKRGPSPKHRTLFLAQSWQQRASSSRLSTRSRPSQLLKAMPSPRLVGGRHTWTVMMLLALVAVYGVGSVKPQKNIDKKSTKVTNPNALAHMNVKAKFGPRTPSFEATGSTKGTHRIELTSKDLV